VCLQGAFGALTVTMKLFHELPVLGYFKREREM
jgi:heme A synthase